MGTQTCIRNMDGDESYGKSCNQGTFGSEILIPIPIGSVVFFFTLSRNSLTPTECPTIKLNSDVIYLEIVLDPTVKGSILQNCPTLWSPSDVNCKSRWSPVLLTDQL